MDILFSHHAIVARPSSAMADVDRRAETLRTNSFQRMLELEQQHKMERLQSPTVSPPASPPPLDEPQGRLPLQVRRADSLSQQQNYLMLKAQRRSIALTPLSISIPHSSKSEKRGVSREPEDEMETEQESQRGRQIETGATVEPLHKQVKFLAPDEEDEDMSDQSSICQSPSWEGYGQKKKEKKLEAERRKKEKEQAVKEAKAAKKRIAARLSKSPPPSTDAARSLRAGALSFADRSMSDPMLISKALLMESQLTRSPEDIAKAASTDDLQHTHYRPAVAEILSNPATNIKRFVGGVRLDWEKEMALHEGQPSPSFTTSSSTGEDGPDSRQGFHKSYSTPAVTARQDSKAPHEAFPPSASRTPMLRQASTPSHSRSNSLLQGATRMFRGRDGKSHGTLESKSASQSTERGRKQDDGHVRRQREQSTERAMAGLVDEQLVGPDSFHSSSTRSSSRNTQHKRRSSLTRDAKAVAMKLTGFRTTPTREEPGGSNGASGQNDYFNFMERSYSTTESENPALAGSNLTSIGHQDNVRSTPVEGLSASESNPPRGMRYEVHERPATSHSSAGSIVSNQSKRGRSLKDAAKAALHISKGNPPSSSASKPPALVPPYFQLRSRMQSSELTSSTGTDATSGPAMAVPAHLSKAARVLGEYNSETMRVASSQPSGSSPMVKATELDSQTGSRISEGSSSSSAYEDGSPLPSPVTTPDTSRPQSSRGLPLATGEAAKGTAESVLMLDDERTHGRSFECSEGSDKSITPRLEASEVRETVDIMDEDRWSRTALPLDIDCDAQSFTTSVSHIDSADNANTESYQSEMGEGREVRDHGAETHSLRRVAKSQSDPNLFIEAPSKSADVTSLPTLEEPVSIPPRSRKRDQASATRSRTVPAEKNTEPVENSEDRIGEKREKPKKSQQSKSRRVQGQDSYEPGSQRVQLDHGASSTSSSESSTFFSNPYFVDLPDSAKATEEKEPTPNTPRSPPPVPQYHRPSVQPRMHSVPIMPTIALPPSAPTPPPMSPARPVTATPVSILKQPTRSASDPASAGLPSPSSAARPPVLSALPKHMQLQAGISAKPSAAGPGSEPRMVPIAKMFVECCSCKYYHDMPSKVYECMARPDAVVEDHDRGISGAIVTMVKCPWCKHNMSSTCCAGYAAVVYLKEKLH
ncbi:hypothetical protein B0H63DRAFT_40587 [Podospora didyma]|uniref:Uncharacterized protein n=1 Tax=Podospora didyma TaxID=330526 RepID=A0AAE0P6M9_9PEZI|nr:hypothetical protein B0H63DRAFT_40587 [Podospora didyma]